MCTSCNYKTGMMKHLVRHEQTHSKDTPYACDKCDYKTKTDYSLKAHSFYHQDPKFLCDKCDYKSCSSGNLHSHKIAKHSTLKHECEQCGKLFNYKRHLSRHQANHEDGNMPCNECDKKFYRKDKLNDHLRYVHQKPAIEATKLVSEFADPPLLQITKENNENTFRNHSCAQCPKTFTCSKHLSRHKNSVHSAVELTCQFCQKTFSRKDKLNVHMNFSCKLKI
jgi:KRAB domain-containing zinc finger protein